MEIPLCIVCYDEVIHWRKVLFKLPSGKSGRAFVSEVCHLYNAYVNGSALECVAMKAVMIMPVLLLQRPHHRSKNHESIAHLIRRLAAWCSGDIDTLVQEGRVLQGNLKLRFTHTHRTEDTISRRFSNFMMNGRVKDALRLLSEDNCVGALSLNSTVLKALFDKHPKGQSPLPSTLIGGSSGCAPPSHPIVFEEIDGICVRHAALRTGSAAGPSGLDAAAWHRMCTSFQRNSDDLCEAVASVARRLCTCFVDPSGLTAFVACRLIALDKCPGVRPIGVGETARRVIAKAVLSVIQMIFKKLLVHYSCVLVNCQGVRLLFIPQDRCFPPLMLMQ